MLSPMQSLRGHASDVVDVGGKQRCPFDGVWADADRKCTRGGVGWRERRWVPVTHTSPSVLTLLALRTHQLWTDTCSRTTVSITVLSQQDLEFLIIVAPPRPSRGPSLSPRMYITRSTAHPYG